MIGILLVVLVVLLALRMTPYVYGPVGLILLIVVVLALTGRL
jgi:hypothetical protein